jgi:pantothenate kinase type III
MRKTVIWIVLGLVILMGCRSYLSYERHSSSDIPFHKRKPPSLNKAIIISTKGPQLEPKNYEIMGKVNSKIENITTFQKHCKDAIEMLRYEAEVVGADALMNVSCRREKWGAAASGTAITFNSRDQALKVLEDINAIIE